MLVLAFRAGYGFGHFEYGLLIYVRGSCFAPVGHEELRGYRSTEHLVFAPQLPFQEAEAMEEDQLGLQLRFRYALFGYERVAGDERVVGGFEAVHVQSYDRPFCQQDRVQAVGHEVLHRLQPAERAAVFLAKADIAPDVVYCASRFLATDQPVLVSALHREIGLAPDAYRAKTGQSGFG